MTDFKVGDIVEVRDNGPILKAGERFTVKEVIGQRIRVDRLASRRHEVAAQVRAAGREEGA